MCFHCREKVDLGSGLEVFLSTRRLVELKIQEDTETHPEKQETCLSFSSTYLPLC